MHTFNKKLMKYSQADYYGDSKLNFVSFYNKFKDAKKKKMGGNRFYTKLVKTVLRHNVEKWHSISSKLVNKTNKKIKYTV